MDSNCDSSLFHMDFEMSSDCMFHRHIIYGPH